MKTILTVAAVLLAVSAVAAAPDGKALYEKKCGLCHGNDGVAKKTAAGSKNFNDPEFKKSATLESVLKSTHEGVGKMKPVKLTDEEAKAIAEYLLALPAKN
jgi:mono/diheme cytochrome c family protein